MALQGNMLEIEGCHWLIIDQLIGQEQNVALFADTRKQLQNFLRLQTILVTNFATIGAELKRWPKKWRKSYVDYGLNYFQRNRYNICSWKICSYLELNASCMEEPIQASCQQLTLYCKVANSFF